MTPECFVFLPQMRMTMDDLVARARSAEAAGFAGMVGMDHLAPPGAEDQPMYEAMVAATWLAARTERLRVGSLVLCDAFRHPAVLARQAVSLDHASGGRFELGIGWGSVADEIGRFGVGAVEPRERADRLRETLAIVTALWSGEEVDFSGTHVSLHGARQLPVPLGRIPIVIGGAGRHTMSMVAEYADWWNLHTGILDRLEEMRPLAGSARVSVQLQVALVPSEDRRVEITETTRRRFGRGAVVGSAPELVEHLGTLGGRGVARVYLWFCDFARPETLAAFGEDVIARLR